MIAIWHVDNSSPYHIYSLEVEDEDLTSLIERIDKEEMPLPENGEFVFIEGDKVVNQISLYT